MRPLRLAEPAMRAVLPVPTLVLIGSSLGFRRPGSPHCAIGGLSSPRRRYVWLLYSPPC